MVEPIKASFVFSTFSIPKFSYTETEDAGMSIELEPKGEYIENEGVFNLTLRLIGVQDNPQKDLTVDLTGIALFSFSPGFPSNQIPDFFYTNSIAIFFPYIRAFLSSLTLQANTRLIILDLLNLTHLAEHLRDNTEFKKSR